MDTNHETNHSPSVPIQPSTRKTLKHKDITEPPKNKSPKPAKIKSAKPPKPPKPPKPEKPPKPPKPEKPPKIAKSTKSNTPINNPPTTITYSPFQFSPQTYAHTLIPATTFHTPIIEPSKPLFINKYKPQTIDDFYSNDKLKQILKTLMFMEDLNILMVGNSCSGKTTLLNAIVREYYGFFPEQNVLYINNLKEQGIGFFRNEMKTFSQSHSGIFGKKKMIVIDDIDTINEQSQQVFRNYIDKYKSNVFFLSVCTNIQKVIDSIQSRVHILRIDPPTISQIQDLMEHIIAQERMNISLEAKHFILKHSQHSIRTMINYMEKIHILYPATDAITNATPTEERLDISVPITVSTCMLLCTDIQTYTFQTYFNLVKSKQYKDAIQFIYGIYDFGFSVIDILEMMFVFVKSSTEEEIDITETEKYEIIKTLCKYITIFYSVHEDVIELALFTHDIGKIFALTTIET